MTGRRQQAEIAGRRAERLAALYLRAKGYRIVERRYKTPVGEVDLIARKGRVLAFVEVKWRRDLAHLPESVGRRQRDRISRAALAYLAHHAETIDLDVRFDVLLLGTGLPRHIRAAWGQG